MTHSNADVLIVGAGPVGLTLAAELARHGVSSRIIDKLPAPLPYCRAIGVSPRSLEVWDDMGVVREMIDAGIWFTGRRRIMNGPPSYRDACGEFQKNFGSAQACLLVRPDGYLAWRGKIL